MSIKRVFSIGTNTTKGSNTSQARFASAKTRFSVIADWGTTNFN
jgi:hypothetical protein